MAHGNYRIVRTLGLSAAASLVAVAVAASVGIAPVGAQAAQATSSQATSSQAANSPAGSTPASAAGSYVIVADGTEKVPALSLTVDQLIGMGLRYDTMRVGEIGDVLADASGNVVAVVAEYGGWFGMFQDGVILPLSYLKPQNGYIQTTMAPEEMQRLPAWE